MNICINCFKDKYIQEFIKKQNIRGKCEICGADNVNICPSEELKWFIKQAINKKYYDYYSADLESPASSETKEAFDEIKTSTENIYTILDYYEDIFDDDLEETDKKKF